MRNSSAFILVGPTAVGKTAVAHHLAREYSCDILSADSMLVYGGLNIGTAKPTPAERNEVRYGGIDIVTPDRSFNTADYLVHARGFLKGPAIVAGGTGLYIKALTQGLDDAPGADEEFRRSVEAWSVERLREELRRVDPERLARLSDPENPRRLIRALELSAAGAVFPSLEKSTAKFPIVGIRIDRAALDVRIRDRVRQMFSGGLLEEAQRLRAGTLSLTARQAIGYAEAFAVLDGGMNVAQAVERTVVRTRQLAKRQMTWFRNQANVIWVDAPPDMSVADLARSVDELWKKYGPTNLGI